MLAPAGYTASWSSPERLGVGRQLTWTSVRGWPRPRDEPLDAFCHRGIGARSPPAMPRRTLGASLDGTSAHTLPPKPAPKLLAAKAPVSKAARRARGFRAFDCRATHPPPAVNRAKAGRASARRPARTPGPPRARGHPPRRNATVSWRERTRCSRPGSSKRSGGTASVAHHQRREPRPASGPARRQPRSSTAAGPSSPARRDCSRRARTRPCRRARRSTRSRRPSRAASGRRPGAPPARSGTG